MQLAAVAEKRVASVTVTIKERDMIKRSFKLTNPGIIEFPFTFDARDDAFYKGEKVMIKDGRFEGEHRAAYQVTYVTKSPDGKMRLVRQKDLSKRTRKG